MNSNRLWRLYKSQEGDDGIARFSGLGRQGALIELLTEQQISQSIDLIDALLSHYLHPETAKLEAEIEKHCSGLSSEELRMLQTALHSREVGNPRVVRSWPHCGKY